MFGAGTGLLFLLRWFWWRINAWAELAAMIGSGLVSLAMAQESLGGWLAPVARLPVAVGITTALWLAVMWLTPATPMHRLRQFYETVRPAGPGWSAVRRRAVAEGRPLPASTEGPSVAAGLLATVVGCVLVYAFLFATGAWLYGRHVQAMVLTAVVTAATIVLITLWPRVRGITGSHDEGNNDEADTNRLDGAR